MVEGFSWLIDDIKENNINTEKTLIYCKTQKDCGKLFCIFKLELGTSAYCSSTAEHQSENIMIGMYHHNTLLASSTKNYGDFFQGRQNLLCCICDNCFGNGSRHSRHTKTSTFW